MDGTGQDQSRRSYGTQNLRPHAERTHAPLAVACASWVRAIPTATVLMMKAMNIDNAVNFPFPTPPDREGLKRAEQVRTTGNGGRAGPRSVAR